MAHERSKDIAIKYHIDSLMKGDRRHLDEYKDISEEIPEQKSGILSFLHSIPYQKYYIVYVPDKSVDCLKRCN
ncbi:MAG: hypothetical protein AMDU3_IPLC00004G0044 [Thermoplasmatales archaeon I-plasma]|jgi:hypothetical protein|nr:MAG: hypothetical protein AMDU3_IPLC00004G0044 [Thermoplasmatales archaeon I-plasma]